MAQENARAAVKRELERAGFAPNKKLGQNFLVDDNMLKKIVREAKIEPGENVLEIGPGLGALTGALLESPLKKLVSVEIDRGYAGLLREKFAGEDRFQLVESDFLKLDAESFLEEVFQGEPFLLVANLPYQVTTPVLMTFLDKDVPIKRAYVMVQKEVGERVNAEPGSKKYGALTVNIALKAVPSQVVAVPASCFYPAPKVDSMVLGLDFEKKERPYLKDEELYHRIVKASFQERRKTMVNGLTHSGFDKEKVLSALETMGKPATLRGEVLSAAEFAELANLLAE